MLYLIDRIFLLSVMRMKKYIVLSLLLMCSSFLTHAADKPPLRVGVVAFAPPFVMQSSHQEFYGFDIATMHYVCTHLKRQCNYIPMALDELMLAVETGDVDLGIGGIIITLQRSRLVRFSTPYLPSDGQFITSVKTNIKPPFNLKQLSGKRIGTLNGSAFERTVRFMEIKKPHLVSFERDGELIDALRAQSIKLALLSVPKAHYWMSNSSGLFKPIGEPFPVGFGFSVAIAPNQPTLTQDLNAAMFAYHASDDFKHNYNVYFKNEF
jgi:polar amino acid transport system substrate-binding protein